MVEVYFNVRPDLLVVKKGFPMPGTGAQGKWRKSKKRVIRVSDEIRQAIQSQGYYIRKLSGPKKAGGADQRGVMPGTQKPGHQYSGPGECKYDPS